MPRPPIAPALIAYALDPCAYAVFASPSALAVCSPTLNVSDSYRCTHSRTQLAAENLFLRKQLALYLERQVTVIRKNVVRQHFPYNFGRTTLAIGEITDQVSVLIAYPLDACACPVFASPSALSSMCLPTSHASDF